MNLLAAVADRHQPPPTPPRPWATQARPDQLPPPGDWFVWLILAGRGWGKALALNTPIPTPAGWTTMGDIRPGDRVLDDNGRPCLVTYATEVQLGRTCYEVVFSDGNTIIADAEHRWLTWTHAARKSSYRAQNPTVLPTVKTTADILGTLRQGKRGDLNHSIALTAPLDLPDADLPIDPYVLGVWLGDGSSRCAEVTTADPEVLDHIREAGHAIGKPRRAGGKAATYPVGVKPPRRDGPTGRMVENGSLTSALRGLGVLDNKHIPAVYLRASAPQRLALLEGLMDTDGTIGTDSNDCEFTSTNERLAEGAAELVVSLGWRCATYKGRAMLRGVDCGPKYRVSFSPSFPPFRLVRKRDRFRPNVGQRRRHAHRMIVDVRPVPSVAVRCITVDSPSHLYLAGRGMIPTHNTRSGAEWLLEQALAHPRSEWAIVAPTFGAARDVCTEGPSGLLRCAQPGEVTKYVASLGHVHLVNGSRIYLVGATDPDKLRGFNLSGAWADELAAWEYEATWTEGLIPAVRDRRGPARVMVTTTPKPKPLLRSLLARTDGSVAVVRGSTFDNAANLSPGALEELRARYAGTRLGRQELDGELLDDIEGALWTIDRIDTARVDQLPERTARIVVGVDPAVTSTRGSDLTGIVVAAVTGHGPGAEFWVLEDRTGRYTPQQWATVTVSCYQRWQADRVVAEVNNGGDLVESTLRTVDPHLPVRKVHASRGKQVRAEPVAALYEQGRVHHVGHLAGLEDQMISWDPTDPHAGSPDRVDALVWAVTDLMAGGGARKVVYDTPRRVA